MVATRPRSTVSRAVVVESKLQRPALPDTVVERPRLAASLAGAWRVALMAAPPGYGKTTAARHWVAATGIPNAWVSVDVLDGDPVTFWLHVIRAIRSVAPGVDDEPERALLEGTTTHLFLAILAGQIERSVEDAAIVLDDLARIGDRSVLDGLAVLVDRVGDRLRLLITARTDPLLPLARWRSAGWVVDVREDQLRFRDDEALAVASAFGGLHLARPTVLALNRRVEGWPIALHLALVSMEEHPDSETVALALTTSDRVITDFIVSQVLDSLTPAEREAALVLSVLDWFDPEVAVALAGPDVGAVIAELGRRRLLLGPNGRPGGTRFHRLLRELLEGELAWRDPVRHDELHRAAARLFTARGDLNAAYRHLVAVGDVAAANDLVMEPTLRLVDRGDREGLALMLGTLPRALRIRDPRLALDLAVAWFFAGNVHDAARWCELAEFLTAGDDPTIRLRVHATRTILALMDGDLQAAADGVDAFALLERRAPADGPIERRFATVGARVALARRDLPAARRWLDRARVTPGPDAITKVTVPGLEAWFDLLSGRLDSALGRVRAACDLAEAAGMRPHHGAFDALVTAAWVHLAAGDLPSAHEYAEAARADAELLACDWNRVRAAAVAAQVLVVRNEPAPGIAIVRDTRAQLAHPASTLARELDLAEAKLLLLAGRAGAASALVDAAPDGPATRLLRAAILLAEGRPGEVGAVLGGFETWLPRDRMEADVLAALADPVAGERRLAAVVEDAGVGGWVLPLVGHGPRVDEILARQPLDRIHPGLARLHRSRLAPRSARPTRRIEALTAREQTVLELLPSHLSYAQIGARLYLSVNTVKSNLKTIYRKLRVTTRSEAVDVAHAAGLLSSDGLAMTRASSPSPSRP